MRLTPCLAALATTLLVATLAPAQSAEELIPFEKLDVDLRDELWKITQRYTVRRKLEERTVKCTAETYEWLLQHLSLASVAARELDLGKYVIEDKEVEKDKDDKEKTAKEKQQKKPFTIDDKDGAQATCERVFEEKGRIVILAKGELEPKPLPKVKGTGVIIVRWKEDPKEKKQTLADCYVFFRVSNDALHRVSQPFRETLGKFLGTRLEGLVDCAVKVGELSDKDPDKVEKALEKSKKVKDDDLDAFKKKFLLN